MKHTEILKIGKLFDEYDIKEIKRPDNDDRIVIIRTQTQTIIHFLDGKENYLTQKMIQIGTEEVKCHP